MGKDAKARIQKGKLLSFVPTGEYYFTKGIKAYHQRDYRKSKKYLERALQLEPGEPMIASQLSIVLTELGEFENSNHLLHIILEELDEEMNECHYLLANNYAHLGFFKDAYHHAQLYLELDPDGDFAEETEDLLELLTFEADDLEEELYEQDELIMKQEKARNLLETGYFPKAIELLKDVVEKYPEYWSAYNNLSLAYFYLGKSEKAESILADVLKRNPGNLHALCNRLLFAHYQGQIKKAEMLKDSLYKIKPMLAEHQFKLGTTFALVGEYKLAYVWLKKLYKKGFEGDSTFYYWLSYTAFYIGEENFARNIWKLAVQMNPDKEGHEPWNAEEKPSNSFEDCSGSIFQRLESDYIEQRMFAIFLASISDKKDEILSSKRLLQNSKLTPIEKKYISAVKLESPSHMFEAHEIAESLYEKHQPIGTAESGLYLMWFSVFIQMVQSKMDLKNKNGWAGAMEYVWYKRQNEKISQQDIAERYGVSPSTVGKYVKIVNSLLN